MQTCWNIILKTTAAFPPEDMCFFGCTQGWEVPKHALPSRVEEMSSWNLKPSEWPVSNRRNKNYGVEGWMTYLLPNQLSYHFVSYCYQTNSGQINSDHHHHHHHHHHPHHPPPPPHHHHHHQHHHHHHHHPPPHYHHHHHPHHPHHHHHNHHHHHHHPILSLFALRLQNTLCVVPACWFSATGHLRSISCARCTRRCQAEQPEASCAEAWQSSRPSKISSGDRKTQRIPAESLFEPGFLAVTG